MTHAISRADAEISALSERINALKQERSALIASRPEEVVPDMVLTRSDGSPTSLSDLMGDRDELFVVHNMGRRCRYCSLWADGFVGLARQLESRAPFVLCANDPPEIARETAAQRGWTYTVVCNAKQPDGRGFSQTLGYGEGDDSSPGISAFRRVKRGDGSRVITRTGHAPFGPGDDYCAAWPILELIGVCDAWEPLP